MPQLCAYQTNKTKNPNRNSCKFSKTQKRVNFADYICWLLLLYVLVLLLLLWLTITRQTQRSSSSSKSNRYNLSNFLSLSQYGPVGYKIGERCAPFFLFFNLKIIIFVRLDMPHRGRTTHVGMWVASLRWLGPIAVLYICIHTSTENNGKHFSN